MQGLKNLPEVGPGGQVLEAPTCCQRAPPCVRPPPRPTPDWAFWHLCVCVHYTAHSHLEPAPVARPVPALAHVLVVPIIRAVTQEGKPLTPGDGAFVWGSLAVVFGYPHFGRAVCRPRGQLHPSPKLSSCFPSTEGISSSCSKTHIFHLHSPSPNKQPQPL